MDKSELITLEAPTYAEDAIGQLVQTGVVHREIFCRIQNVKRAEWAAAAHNGKRAAYCVTVWADEYQGEEVAILNGTRYSIYRTYSPNGDDTELYLEQKAGV